MTFFGHMVLRLQIFDVWGIALPHSNNGLHKNLKIPTNPLHDPAIANIAPR